MVYTMVMLSARSCHPNSKSPAAILLVFGVCFAASLATVSGHALVFTEIHFHPGQTEDPQENLEFVEIYNDDSIVVDLSGHRFSSGLDFTFPDRTFLPARSYLVVCRNVEAVTAHYGIDNAIGDFSGRLDNTGEWIRLVNPMGSTVAETRYRNGGEGTFGADAGAAADGTGLTLAISSFFGDTRNPDTWVRSSQLGGTPGAPNFPAPLPNDREILGEGQLWRYKKGWNDASQELAEFSDPPDAWRQFDFDDSAWLEGPTPIGFNEHIIQTVLDDMHRTYISFAVRREFTVGPEAFDAMESLVLRARIDDGAVIYLNGADVRRFQLPGASGEEVPVDTKATGSSEIDSAREFFVPKDNVQLGQNLLAVQVHNLSVNSADAGFDLAVFYRTFQSFPGVHVPTVVFNEIVSRAAAEERNVELYNLSDMALDLSGFHLTDTPFEPDAYTFPEGSWISPQDFLTVTERNLRFPLTARGETVSLFLYTPDQKNVLDAARLRESDLATGVLGHARLPDGDGTWMATTTPTFGSANRVDLDTRVVINEIHFNPRLSDGEFKPLDDTRSGEFVELYNRSQDIVLLEGFKLTSGFRFAFQRRQTLSPGEYLVVARDPLFIRDLHDVSPDQVVGPASGSLSDRGELIRLEDSFGNPADEVFYSDEGEWVDLADGGGSSLELLDPDQDNATPLAWSASEERDKAPWVEIDYEAEYPISLPPGVLEHEMHIFLLSSGECLLDGISLTSNLASETPIEHIANGDFEGDTLPWRLWGNHTHSSRTVEGAKFGTASLHLVATGGGNNKVNRIEVDVPAIVGGRVRVRLWARWLGGSNALHISGHNNTYGRTIWLPTPRQTGTPGRENSVRASLRESTGVANQGPVITAVRHEPAVPEALAPVSFHARVTDSDGVQSVTLRYVLDSDPANGGDRQLPLLDNGARIDGEPGAGHYSGELPGFTSGELVSFWIEAMDAGGRTQNFPRGAPGTKYTFAVDETLESPVHRYRMVLDRDSHLALQSRHLHSNDLVAGTFIFEESEVYYNVGYRYHGSPWNRPPSPRMFRVRFNGDRPFRHSTRRINVSRYGSAQNEGTAYQLLNKAGEPGVTVPRSPNYNYAKIKLNTNNHTLSAMAGVGVVSRDYARFNWPQDSDGHAYKISGKIAFNDQGSMIGDPDWTALRVYNSGPYAGTQSPENHRFYYNPKLKRDADSFAELIDLLKAMNRRYTSDEDYDVRITEVLNVESVLRVYLTRILQDDWDSIGIGNGQNAYLYFAPIEGRFYYIPWDMDHTFANASAFILPPRSDTGFRRLVTRPIFRRMFGRILDDFLDDYWSVDYVSEWTARVEETTSDTRVQSASGIRNFVKTRVLRAGSPLNLSDKTFTVRTPSPVAVASEELVIQGEAPIQLEFIFVSINGENPQPAEIRWSVSGSEIPFEWEIDVKSLRPGINELEVLGLSANGDVLGSVEGFEVFSNTSPFVRGDVDGDLRINLTDAIRVLQHAFHGQLLDCSDAADVNDDAKIMADDAIRLLLYIFSLGPPPAAPFPEAGFDRTDASVCAR